MSERMLAPTAPAPGLPDQVKIFLFAVGIATTAISMPALLHGGRPHGWIAFAVLAGAAAAVIVYVVLNNGSFAVILHLARGHSPRDILNPQTLSADAALACLGIAFAHFWQVDAWLLPFAIAPLALLHAALHLPQLRE